MAVAGVDLDLLADDHEQRHLDLRAGLQDGRLGTAGGPVPLQPGVGVADRQLDRRRQLDVERNAVVHGNGRRHVLQQVAGHGTHGLRGDVQLVVGGGVHEDVVAALPVEVGHLPPVDSGHVDFDAGVEGAVHHLAGAHVLHRGPHECATLTGLDVLELDHRPELSVAVEGDAVLQVIGGRHDDERVRRAAGTRTGRAPGPPQSSRSSRGAVVNSSGPFGRTTRVSSIRTPPRPGKYTPGSTVTGTLAASTPVAVVPSVGASWISRPTPWPSPCGNCSPYPAVTIMSRAAASTAWTSAPTASAARDM